MWARISSPLSLSSFSSASEIEGFPVSSPHIGFEERRGWRNFVGDSGVGVAAF